MVGTLGEEGFASDTRNNGLSVNTEIAFAFPEFRDRVDLIIHEGLNDMWLLLTGEEIKTGFRLPERRDGRPLGLQWDGQIHMLTSKPSALETLRVLGIEMF